MSSLPQEMDKRKRQTRRDNKNLVMNSGLMHRLNFIGENKLAGNELIM